MEKLKGLLYKMSPSGKDTNKKTEKTISRLLQVVAVGERDGSV